MEPHFKFQAFSGAWSAMLFYWGGEEQIFFVNSNKLKGLWTTNFQHSLLIYLFFLFVLGLFFFEEEKKESAKIICEWQKSIQIIMWKSVSIFYRWIRVAQNYGTDIYIKIQSSKTSVGSWYLFSPALGSVSLLKGPAPKLAANGSRF